MLAWSCGGGQGTWQPIREFHHLREMRRLYHEADRDKDPQAGHLRPRWGENGELRMPTLWRDPYEDGGDTATDPL